jgi:polyhydroxyalkanoate synthesis regulator phasin
MRKLLIGIGLVVAIALTALGVAAVDPVGAVSAAVTGHTKAGDKAGPLGDALDELVADGTISQDQADAVMGKVQSKRQERWAERPHLGRKLVEGIAADLGMSQKDLMVELRSGKSIADVARDKGVDPQKVIDDVVGAITTKIDQRVADGKLDQAKADTMKQHLSQRVTDFVNRVWGQARADAKARRQADKQAEQAPSTEAPSTTDTTQAPSTSDTTQAPSSPDTTQAPSSPGSTEAPAGTSPGTTAGA